MLRATARSLATTARRPTFTTLRPLSSSSPLRLARQPTFTTPEPSAAPPAAPHDPSAPLEPLPPTNLPVEDYASPLLHTASFFSQLFRYAVFASCGIVGLSLTGLVAVHLYVEHVELAPAKLAAGEDPDEWTEEAEGWSGAHTGRGGTDPRLGVIARAAVRGAWLSQNWGGGLAVSPVASHSPSPGSSSPFGALAKPGGQMIGAADEVASRGKQVADAGWAMAERYLVFALRKAQERGISLQDSVDWEAHVEQGGVDRAAVELEERLAGLRERVGGRYKLEAAREGWERIYYALASSPTTDAARGAEIEWERREKLKATRKLGELSGRIAELWRDGSDERVLENRKAEGWFIGGLVPVLAEEEGRSLQGKALEQLVPTPEFTKHVSPSSSFFSFWSRSHPPSSPAAATPAPLPKGLSPELAHLLALLPSASNSPRAIPSAATSRALISSLVSLETFLARRRDSSPAPSASALAASSAVQRGTLSYLSLLLRPYDATAPASPASTLTGSGAPQSAAAVSRSLSHLFYLTRRAAVETHLAETGLALAALQRRGPAKPADVAAAVTTLEGAMAAASGVVEAVKGTPMLEKLADEGKAKKAGEMEKAFGEQVRRVKRDAEKVVDISGALKQVVEGLQGLKR
ncbi:hypothetical protein JCM10213_006355 [Rhodosporidiobolus nylandii]